MKTSKTVSNKSSDYFVAIADTSIELSLRRYFHCSEILFGGFF